MKPYSSWCVCWLVTNGFYHCCLTTLDLLQVKLQAVMLFTNIRICILELARQKPSTDTPCNAPKSSTGAPCVSRCHVFLSPPTQVSLQPVYLNPTSQHDTVAGDRPGNYWHRSSGKIMSSHRPETGRRACVCARCLEVYVCLCVFPCYGSTESQCQKRDSEL